jgi:hypothetical protein
MDKIIIGHDCSSPGETSRPKESSATPCLKKSLKATETFEWLYAKLKIVFTSQMQQSQDLR